MMMLCPWMDCPLIDYFRSPVARVGLGHGEISTATVDKTLDWPRAHQQAGLDWTGPGSCCDAEEFSSGDIPIPIRP